MMSILSKRSNQFIFLTQLLYQREVRQQEVLRKMDVSKNTLNQILQEYNTLLYPVHCSTHLGILTLNMPQFLSYDYCISKILEDSLEYQIIEIIFFDEYHTYSTLAEELFISESTLKRTIKEINNNLKNSGCQIKPYPLQIEGDEFAIRSFLCVLLQERYGLLSLPFSVDEQKFVEQVYYLGNQIFDKETNMQEYLNYKLFSLVALKREENGHSLKKVPKLVPTKLFLEKIVAASTDLIFFKKSKIVEADRSVFFYNVFYFFLQEDNLRITHLEQEELNKIYEENGTKLFVDMVCRVINVSLPKSKMEDLYREVHEVLFGYLQVPLDVTTVRNIYDGFDEYNDFYIPEFRWAMRELLIKIFGEEKLEYFTFILFIITTHIHGWLSNMFHHMEKTRIGIYIDFDYAFGKYIGEKLRLLIPNEADIKVYHELSDLTADFEEETDILVTNIYQETLEIVREKTVCISRFMAADDIKLIIDMAGKNFKQKYKRGFKKRLAAVMLDLENR